MAAPTVVAALARAEAPRTERPEVYVNEYSPWFGVLVSEANPDEARRAVEAEYGPSRYLGIRTEAILHEDGRPGRRRRFHVFTDEPPEELPRV